jgi:ubiquinone/menaquinone biosynthesis C-methylase UbiE
MDMGGAITAHRYIMSSKPLSAEIAAVAAFNDRTYQSRGFEAQRRYPNEEFLRFMGTHYFGVSLESRKSIRVLEVGCGSGSNLWMVAREGFEAHGLDLSAEGISLCREMLRNWECSAILRQGDMTRLDYPDRYFDVIADVFSSYSLVERDFRSFLREAARVIKPGGRLFMYTPSKSSDAFLNFEPATKLDEGTLSGIERKTSAYYPQHYPFRFVDAVEFANELTVLGFGVTSLERIGRTYRSGDEYFEFLSVHASMSFSRSPQIG